MTDVLAFYRIRQVLMASGSTTFSKIVNSEFGDAVQPIRGVGADLSTSSPRAEWNTAIIGLSECYGALLYCREALTNLTFYF